MWGHDPHDLTVSFTGANLDSLVNSTAQIDSVVLRATTGRDHLRVERVRRENREWLGPWEASLPPDTTTALPTWSEFPRFMDQRHAQGQALSMMVEVNGEIAGLITLGAIERGAIDSGALGYWITEKWAGKGVTSLAVAAVIDLLLGPLGLHRVEVNVRPENIPSMGLARKLGLREEGYRKNFMHINGRWADHVSFAITREDPHAGSLVEMRIRQRP